MQTIWQDVRHGCRGFTRQPGFTSLAILTLALGIGAATTIFSVIQNVLLNPFPYKDTERVVAVEIRDTSSSRPGGRTAFLPPELLEYQEQQHVFEEVTAARSEDVLQATTEGTEQLVGARVSSNTFSFLGVPPLIGRGLEADDFRADAPPVFVMAHRMWLGRYNLDPGVIGRTFVLNGVATTCVGVMPERFTFFGSDLWRPVILTRADPEVSRRPFMLLARLKPDVSFEQAQADIEVIARRLAKTYPASYPKQFAVRIVSWVETIVGQFRATLYAVATAVGLLLLIGCSNVANMLLARGAAREREIAIRLSLGATRTRVVAQLLVESLMLALAGAMVGCLFAEGGIKGLVLLMPQGLIPREAAISLNVIVLVFSLAIAIVTALLFGLAPALQTARRDMVEPLKTSRAGGGGAFRRGRLRNVLVAAEVALSLVLLAGAGLLMRGFVNLQQQDLGFNPDSILVARLPLPRGQYNTIEAKQRFFRELLPRLHSLPGVVGATTMSSLPPYPGITSDIDIQGAPQLEQRRAAVHLVSEGYFSTLGVRLIRGRLLSAVDVNDARRVAIVNQTFVNRFFGNADPLGQRIRISLLEALPESPVPDPVFEIVGVISDTKNQGPQEPPMPEALISYATTAAFERGILVRTSSEPDALVNAVRREVWAVDRTVAVSLTGSLKQFLTRFSYAEPRFALVLFGLFATIGLALVAVGVYSVIAYTVSRQTQEIGIRMALGATRSNVLGMTIRMGLQPVAMGLVIGLAASVAATRLLRSQLSGISPHDPVALSAAVSVMALASVAACYFPARRATRVDPIVALRDE